MRLPNNRGRLGVTWWGLIGVIDQGVSSATTFLTAMMVGRFCPKEEFGLYSLAFSIVVFVMILQGGLILTPYTIYSVRLAGTQRTVYTGSTLVHQIGLSLATGLIVLLGILALGSWSGEMRFGYFAIALAASIGFVLLREYVRRLCFANMRPLLALMIDISTSFLQLIGVAILVFTGAIAAWSVYLVMGLACGSVAGSWLYSTRGLFKIVLADATRHLRINSDLGKWIVLSGVAWAASTQAYPWFLGSIKDLEDVGTYAASTNTVAVMNPILLGIGNMVEPILSQAFAAGGISQLRHNAVRTTMLVSGLLLLVGGAIALYGGQLVVALFGNKYAGSGQIVAILSFNTIVVFLNFMLSRCLFILGKSVVDFQSNIVSVAISLSVGLFLVYEWGPTGAAIGLLLTTAAGCPVRLYGLRGLLARVTKNQTNLA